MDHLLRRHKTNLESIFSASHLEAFKRIHPSNWYPRRQILSDFYFFRSAFLDLVDLRSNIHSWRGLTSRTWRWTSSQLIGNRPGWPWTSTGHENTTSGFYS